MWEEIESARAQVYTTILPPCRAVRMANRSATHNWPQSAAAYTGPLRQSAFCLTGMMQSYVTQFESRTADSVRCGRPRSVWPDLYPCLQQGNSVNSLVPRRRSMYVANTTIILW